MRNHFTFIVVVLLGLAAASSATSMELLKSVQLSHEEIEAVQTALAKETFMDTGNNSDSNGPRPAPAYYRAEITVINFLKVPLLKGSVRKKTGRKPSVTAGTLTRVEPGKAVTMVAEANHSSLSGYLEFVLGFETMRGVSSIHMLWSIPLDFTFRSSWLSVGVRNTIPGRDPCEVTFDRMYDGDTECSKLSVKGAKEVIFKHGSILVMGYRDAPGKYRQKIHFRVVSSDPDVNHDFRPPTAVEDAGKFLSSLGTNGIVVWAVLFFFAFGLLIILFCKCFAFLRRRLRKGRKEESSKQEEALEPFRHPKEREAEEAAATRTFSDANGKKMTEIR